MKRLIDGGADVHQRQRPLNQLLERGGSYLPRDVTALHHGSRLRNAAGIRALLDYRGSDVDIADMASVRDSDGRLPLHWATMGHERSTEDMLPKDEIAPRVVDTFKLLLEGKPGTIHSRINLGRTALHYAVACRGICCSVHSDLPTRFLCENGADASRPENDAKNVLHTLALTSMNGDPIGPALLDLLLAHGANVNHLDKYGLTPLYYMAKNLRQVKTAKCLISRGADVSVKGPKGNTPLHAVTMHGRFYPLDGGRVKSEMPTLDNRIRVQDEMIAGL